MSIEIWWLALFFLFVLGAVCAAGYFFLRAAQQHAGADAPSSPAWAAAEAAQSPQDALASALRVVGKGLQKPGPRVGALRKAFFQAGYRSPAAPEIFAGIRIACGLGLAIVAGWAVVLQKDSLWEAVVPSLCAAGFGYYLPMRVLEALIASRKSRIRRALPGALDLLVLAVEAGQPLDQAMFDAARSLKGVYPDLSSELLFCHLEIRAGTPRAEALRHLAERGGEPEMSKLVTVLVDGERFGTSLAPALRTHARFLRIRMRQQAQESARKLSVKLVLPVFFLIFPSILLVTLGPALIQVQQFMEGFLNSF